MNTEIQLERLDGKLEKHIGITETILKNQEVILKEIREEIKSQNNRFLSHDDAEAIHDSVILEVERDMTKKMEGFESRLDKRDKKRWTVATTLIGIVIGGLQIYTAMNQ